MKLDNFELLTPLIDFPDKDTFYFLQIMKRRKDNPEMETGNKIIKSYYLYTENDLNNLKPKIIEHCTLNKARAYLRLNKRSLKKVALQCLKRTTDLIITEDYKAMKDIYEHVAGEFHSDSVKKWILDFDPENVKDIPNAVNKYKEFLDSMRDIESKIPKFEEIFDKTDSKFILEVPTVSGVHLICKPFNLQVLKNNKELLSLGLVDIHKDACEIIYAYTG